MYINIYKLYILLYYIHILYTYYIVYVVTHVDFFFRLDFQGVGDGQDSAAGAGDDGRRGFGSSPTFG